MTDHDNYPEQLVAEAVLDECAAQRTKWGEQNHPLVFSPTARRLFATTADRYKQMNDARQIEGTLAWDGILLEEVFEALAEEDLSNAREELVQVAAVAVSMIVALDRQQSTAGLSAVPDDCLMDKPGCDLACKNDCDSIARTGTAIDPDEEVA